ncbi:Serine/threonine-protein kinase haspin [Dissostichus eleginoides]|uniref:Serine/threonine-protein kinase haspin n=1 Tax=Dissostichus eleginoides TaxID=100907 RepID=A0AAD9BPN6_DISEL|nr:Serine/threonine-protein kinase haspin [Dissostichus eleginoides]
MNSTQPVFMKTYGKKRRMMSAWILPDNRKRDFDSTRSTDGDSFVAEPSKPPRKREKKTSVAARRERIPAKKTTKKCLTEKGFNEENIPCPQRSQKSKTTSGRAVHSAKTKALLCLVNTSNDEEENISTPSSPCPRPAQQIKKTSRNLPSVSRFVTRRRRAAATTPKKPKATFTNILNSSEEFTAGAPGSSRTFRPVRRRVLPSFAENSVNVAAPASFSHNPFQEISLNESTEHSLAARSRKPIFCSTPSAGSFIKRPHLEPLSVTDQSSSLPFLSVSGVGVTFQEDLASPGRPFSPPCSSPSLGLHLEEKPKSSLCEQKADLDHHEELSDDLLVESKGSSCEKKRKSMDRPGTTRKACVSGLSVSRWKNKRRSSKQKVRGSTAQASGNTTVDCSINELISTQHKNPREPSGNNMNFFTPVRGAKLNLSYLLADLTPNTHTWSRLKAALSVHRKATVKHTLGSLRLSESSVGTADLSQDLFATPFRTPFPKHLRSQLVCEDTDLSDAEKVYAECGQPRALPWEKCILPQRMKQCVKIGEGTFGEVFSTTNASGDKVALKIIPVEGSEKLNGEDQKTYGEILHEIIISKDLSSLKDKQQNKTQGFIGLNDLHCVQGCYPPDFLNAWDTFDKKKGSENDRPDFFEKDQLFIILEFEFGGTDLENSNGMLSSLFVAKGILHQVTAALAVAEQELHFEHRDLHWGNVLVQTTKEKRGSFLLNGAAHSLETKGVLVRIIDYSLSRLEIDGLTVSCDISNDEELFMGQGEYQFEIYRLMRQENGNNWSNYHPHSNVLWLHYLCSKLLSMKYRITGGRGVKGMRKQLTLFYDNVLQYSSAMEVLQECPMLQ